MDGCQERRRESRGDRVMSHDRRTCPEASTWHVQFISSWWGQYVRWAYGCCTCVRVQSIFFEVSVVFSYRVTHFMISFLGNFVNLLIQAYWEEEREEGYRLPLEWVFFRLILIHTSPSLILISSRREVHPRVEFKFLLFKQKRHSTQSLSGLLQWEEARISHRSSLLTCSVSFLCHQSQGGESNSSGPTHAEHQRRRRSVRWTECVTSPSGEGCACQESFQT